jgi:hypothetical protein
MGQLLRNVEIAKEWCSWQPMSPERLSPLLAEDTTGQIRVLPALCSRSVGSSAAPYQSWQGGSKLRSVNSSCKGTGTIRQAACGPACPQHAVAGLPAVQFNVMVSSFRCAGYDDQTGPPTILGCARWAGSPSRGRPHHLHRKGVHPSLGLAITTPTAGSSHRVPGPGRTRGVVIFVVCVLRGCASHMYV